MFRHFDAGELSKLSSMPVDLHNFVQAVQFLFIRRPAGCISTGFTSYIIRELQTPRVVFVSGHAKTIGGPNSVNEELIGRCLSRMAGWVRLSIQCIQYEYPHWDVCLAFSVFDIASTKKGRSHGFGADFKDTSFERLATAFGGDAEVLRAQFEDHIGFATAVYMKNQEAGVASAWASSIKRSHGMRLPPDAILRKCVHALQAWDGFTSSEIERKFAAARLLIGSHRQCMDSDMQCRLLSLLDIADGDLDEIIRGARAIWSENWNDARASGAKCRQNF